MKSTIYRSVYNWITNPVPPLIFNQDEQTIPSTTFPISDDIGTVSFSSIQLPLNIVIRRAYHTFNPEVAGQLVPLINVCEEYIEPVLIIQAVKTGRITIADHTLGKEFIFGSSNSLFRHLDKLDSLPKLDTSEDIEVTVLIIGDSVLSRLLGDELARSLLEALQIMTVPSAVITRVPQHVSAILHASMPNNLTGSIRDLFAQAKVLEYICALAENFVGATEEMLISTEREKLIQQICQDLTHLAGKVPTLDEMARQYGMSARLLNDEFKKIYGSSIYSYISDLRLNEAHEALLKSNIPMKSLAMNLGYSHVNHFISAFGRKFGYSPGTLRRKV